MTETTVDTVEIVRRRLADGRTIADSDVHALVAEIDRLRQIEKSQKPHNSSRKRNRQAVSRLTPCHASVKN